MSVTSTTDKSGPFLVTALPQTIPTGFPFIAGSDLLVLDLGPSLTPRDPALVLTLGSDYTVTGGGYDSGNNLLPGSVVLASGANPAVNDYIVIMRGMAINQPSSFVSTNALTLALLEQMGDRLSLLSQQVNEVTARSLQFENFEFLSGILNLASRKGRVLAFDPTTGGATFVLVSDGSTIYGTMALQDADNVNITGGSANFTGNSGLTKAAGAFIITSSSGRAFFKVSSLGTAGSNTDTPLLQLSRSINNLPSGAVVGELRFDGLTTSSAYTLIGEIYVSTTGPMTSTGAPSEMQFLVSNESGILPAATLTPSGFTTGALGTTTLINIKLYGAKGDGTTNDTAAIALAFTAAISSHGALYVPAGTYLTDEIDVTGVTGLAIFGDGIGVSILKGRTGNALLRIDHASSHISVHHLTFNGNCITRTAGQQAVFFDCSFSSFCDNEIINSGEYAFFAGSSTAAATTDIIVSRNIIGLTYADGINLQWVTRAVVSNNDIFGADDDCIALGYNAGGACSFVNVVGNKCKARNDLGTTTGRGILAERVSDCLIEGNLVEATKQTGIFVDSAGGTRPTRISVIGNKVIGCAINSGHNIVAYQTTDCELINNVSENPASGNCIELADWQNLTIAGGVLQQTLNQFCRGIHCDETAASWATTWNRIKVSNVNINLLGASNAQCLYFAPDSSITLAVGSVTGLICDQTNSGDCINLNTGRLGTYWKLGNNVKLQSANTFSPSSSAGVYVVFNNN